MKQIYFWLFFMFVTWGIAGQTTLINPATDGGFENGVTFAANGWTNASSANNPWVVGTAVSTAPFSGNSAYISDSGGTTNTYTPASNASNFFWKDVTVPAGETKIALTFNWSCQGEASYDIWQVYYAPTTVNPVGSTTHPGSGTSNVPTGITGATSVGYGQTTAGIQTVTYFLPASLAGTTFRLIFGWKNETGGTQPPAAIDNISLVSSMPGTYTSIATGNWSAGTTWDAGSAPSPVDSVIISSGNVVTSDLSGQGANNLQVNGTLVYGTTPSSFVVNGNLTVNSGGLINVFNGTTGKQLNVAGNIVNDGRIDLSVSSSTSATTQGNLTLNGANVQTVSGSGTFGGTVTATDATNSVGVIRHLVFANTNTSIPNINWNFNNVRLMNGIVVNANNRVNLNGNKIYFGNFGSFSSGTVTVNNSNSGFYNGSISRWWTTAQTGTGITAGTDPSNSTSRFPFITNSGQNRALYITRSSTSTTGNTAGYTTVSYNDVAGITTGLNIADGTYTVTDRANGNWAITTENGYVYASGTHTLVGFYNNGMFVANNTAARLMYANAAVGTFQNGSVTPAAQRTGLTTAQLTAEPFYIGTNTADVPFVSVATGDWNNASTWNKSSVPTCTDLVTIVSGHTVTVNSTGNYAKNITVNPGGGLTLNSGDLTVGCGANNFNLTNNGFLFVEGGTLTINGYLSIASSSAAFNQSGGSIIIDGNAAGVAASSVLASNALFNCLSTNISLTGGSLLFVDPHAVSGGYTVTFNNATPTASTLSTPSTHLTKFGDGISTDAGGGTNGFYIDTWTGSALLAFGNFEVNGGTGTNRAVTSRYNLLVNGNVTVNANSTMTLGVPLVIGGDLLVNGTYVNTAGGVIATRVSANTSSAMTFSPVTVAQTITNNGTVGNLAASPTANLFALTVNNTSASGLTLNSPISVSGTLTLTNGFINTTNTNLLTLGTATAAGTLSGGSDTSYIKGPFARTIASANANSSYIQYPVGKATYAPIWLAPATTAVTVMKAETFESNTGTVDASITSLSSTRRWEAPLMSGTITDVNVRLGDAAIASNHIPVQAPNASGIYTNAFGSVATYLAGTPNTTQSNSAVTAANYTGFVSYAVSNACSGAPTPGNTVASSTSICLGETVSLSLQNVTTGTGVTYQWMSSIDGASYTNVDTATNSTYSVAPQTSLYYKCAVTCSGSGITTESTPVQIQFANSVASTTPGTRCGNGTVELSATTSSGTLSWYAAASGGESLGTGSTFTSPAISSTTDFYVSSESSTPSIVALGTGSTISTSSGGTFFPGAWGGAKTQYIIKASELTALGLRSGSISSLGFEPTSSSLDYQGFYVKIGHTTSTTAPTSTFLNSGLELVYVGTDTNEGYTPVANSINTLTFGTGAGTSSSFNWDGISNIVISISWSRVPSASTSTSSGMKVDNVGFISTAYRQRDSYTPTAMADETSVSSTSSNRPKFYINGMSICSSPRVAVTATVTPPPVLTLSATSGTICEGESTPAITITAGASDYDTYAWTPSTGVSGDASNGWVFNPTVTTSYVLNASNSVSGCNTSVNGLITVDPLPSALVITPSPLEVCVDTIASLSVTGGASNVVIIDEGFNAPTNNWITTNNSTGGTPADAAWTLRPNGYVYTNSTLLPTFYSNDNSQFYMSNSDDQGSGGTTATLLTSPSFDLSGLNSANLSFWHYYRDYNAADFAKVEVSTDGGGTWNPLVTYSTTQGDLAAFANANLDLTPYVGQSNVSIRFNYTGAYAYYWNIDNVKVSGVKTNPITWQPTTNLYTDATATTAYIDGTNASTVYFKSSVVGGPVTYTVTSTPATLCERTNTVNVTVLPNTTLALTSGSNMQTVCVNTAISDVVYTVSNGTGATATGLPAGVIGTYNAGVYTLSGTPTESGTFNYSVTGTGVCAASNPLTGTLTVNPDTTLALTSGSNTQTVCINTAVEDIVYTVTNGTGATATGLPAGVTGTFNAGVYTLSGTPTESGTFNYSVTGTGLCAASAPLSGTLTINATSAPTGDSPQTFCNAGTVADLVATGTDIKWYDAATAGNQLSASTALVSGHYYATQTLNGCESQSRFDVTVVVNVTPAPESVAAKWTYQPLNGASATPTPNVGTGTSLLVGSMTVSTGAGTATGMNTATGCGTQTSGTLAWALIPNPGTVNESSGAQWNVSSAGLTDIKVSWEQRFSGSSTNTLRLQYTTDGSTWNNFEMSESNTSYCLGTLNDGRFETDITGDVYRRITVDLSSISAANNNPNFGWRVVAAHYQSTGEFRRVTAPTTLVTNTSPGTWRFDNVTLSGTSTQTFCEGATVASLVASGTNIKWYNSATGGTELATTDVLATGSYYASQTLNSCESASRLLVNVVVNLNTSLALTSGSNTQTIDQGAAITDIVYTVTNGTGVTVTGLPNGVTGVYDSGVVTISGTPTQTGVFNYTITGTGLCASSSELSGTITITNCTIGWANLQWPGTDFINTCGTSTYYGQIWIDGVTNAAGAGAGISAWFGISTSNTDPSTWDESVWHVATYNMEVGNNDEYMYGFNGLTAGTYYVSVRYKFNCSDYYYGGYVGGAWNGTSNVNSTLTVDAVAEPTGNATHYICSTSDFTALSYVSVVASGTLVWYDAATAGNVLPATTPMVGGTTYYAANVLGGCESTRFAVTAVDDCALAIDETQFIKMYPNPTSNFLNITSDAVIKTVEVFNYLGQNVKVGSLVNGRLDVSDLPVGTYVIQFTFENGNAAVEQFIKM